MFILTGKEETQNPTSKELEKEILNLQMGQADLIVLEDEKDCVTVLLKEETDKENFYVEITLDDKIHYVAKKNLNQREVMEIFSDFLENIKNFQNDLLWEKYENKNPQTENKTKSLIESQEILFIILLGIGILSIIIKIIQLKTMGFSGAQGGWGLGCA